MSDSRTRMRSSKGRRGGPAGHHRGPEGNRQEGAWDTGDEGNHDVSTEAQLGKTCCVADKPVDGGKRQTRDCKNPPVTELRPTPAPFWQPPLPKCGVWSGIRIFD